MTTINDKVALKDGETMLKGRIEGSRRFDGKTYTHLSQPAASAYDKPALNELISASSLGSVGDEIRVKCRIGGFPRKPYDFTDKSTGEVRRVKPVDNTLLVVEG